MSCLTDDVVLEHTLAFANTNTSSDAMHSTCVSDMRGHALQCFDLLRESTGTAVAQLRCVETPCFRAHHFLGY